MLNTKKLLTNILTKFIVVGDLVTSSTATVAANAGTHEFLMDMTKANYKPIALASLGKDGGANGQLAISHWYFSGNTLRVTIVNNTSTARTIGVEARALYIRGGGYFLKVFSALSRLAERRWEYAEHKETLHETFAGGNLHITHGFKIRDNGWKCNEPGKRIYSAVKRTLADCFRRNSDNNRKRFCERTQQINRGWFRSLCTDSRGKRLPRLLVCGGNEREREIGYVPKHRINTDHSVRTELYQAEIAISERGWACA